MTVSREIELKLELEPLRAGSPSRRGSRKALPPGGETRHVLSRIFDTPQHHLRRRGFVLRVRHDGERRIQTLKSSRPEELMNRAEWEADLSGDQPDLALLPGALRDEIEALGPLQPVLETEFDRTLWRVGRDGSHLELVLDEGAIRAGLRSEPIHEIEIELKAGSLTPLLDLGREIASALPARIGVRSKSERGYALLAGPKADRDSPSAVKAKAPVLHPEMSVGEAFQVTARACLRHFRLNEDGILARQAEALHQGRVAIRRLRSCFRLFRPLVKGREAERLGRELRSLFRLLGTGRNLDVYLDRTLVQEAALHPLEPGLPELRMRIARDREAAYDRIAARLRSRRTRLLMLDLLGFIENGDWRRVAPVEARTAKVSELATATLGRRWRKLRRGGRGLDRLPADTRHQLRIDGKVLRYAAEFFAGAFPGRKARHRHATFVEALEELQSRLGELNDIETGHAVVDALSHSGEAQQPELLVAAGHVEGGQDAHEAELLAAAMAAHKRLRKVEPFWT